MYTCTACLKSLGTHCHLMSEINSMVLMDCCFHSVFRFLCPSQIAPWAQFYPQGDKDFVLFMSSGCHTKYSPKNNTENRKRKISNLYVIHNFFVQLSMSFSFVTDEPIACSLFQHKFFSVVMFLEFCFVLLCFSTFICIFEHYYISMMTISYNHVSVMFCSLHTHNKS